jgi:hypothetical protein
MFRLFVLASILCVSAPCLADRPPLSEAQVEIDGFMHCALDNAILLVGSTNTPDVVADNAMAKCEAEFATLKKALSGLLMRDESINSDSTAVAEETEMVANTLRSLAKTEVSAVIADRRTQSKHF